MSYWKSGLLIASAMSVVGCAGASGSSAYQGSADTAEIQQKEMIISDQQKKIATLEQQLRSRDAALSQAQVASTRETATGSGAAALFPPDPKPGRCYARVLTPAKYETSEETILVREASERIEIIPPEYGTAEESVVIKEASTRFEVVPAQFEEVTEQVLVQPASTRIEEIPASYKTVSEQVLVTSARTEWKRGPATSFSATGNVLDTRETDTGEIMCLVEVPAVYKSVTRKVIDQPAQTREVEIPAEYKSVTKTVLKTPATTREVPVPAEYATVKVTKLVRPAKEQRIALPAEYETVTKQVKVSDEKLAWREVVCEVNLNRDNVMDLQTALKDAGYYDGPIDGIIGPMTMKSANAYATAEGLPGGNNYIPIEVVDSLGLKM